MIVPNRNPNPSPDLNPCRVRTVDRPYQHAPTRILSLSLGIALTPVITLILALKPSRARCGIMDPKPEPEPDDR